MLVYIFWHWPLPSVAPAEYEAKLNSFHQTLAADPPFGFHRSLSFAVASLPWPGAVESGYEDWYFVDDFPALGAINEAAVSGSRHPPHDLAAAAAAGGAGGLYRLLNCALDPGEARVATWVSKPAGIGYREFNAVIASHIAAMPCTLAQRQMVLGPAPEFCFLTQEALPVTSDVNGLTIQRHVVAGH